MLLIDGVRYKEWVPEGPRAEDEFEQEVKEHAQDIFGEQSIYFDRKQKLKSLAGVGSIPDGLVIIFGDASEWHIVEVELSSHDPYQHVVPQVDRFINAVDNPNSRNEIVEALYNAIENDEFTKVKIRQTIGQNKDIHKSLSDLIVRPPTITIVIEKDTSQLREALKKYTQKKVVEFRTFRRMGAEVVHAHLFEPIYISLPKGKPSIEEPAPPSARNQLYQQFFSELIEKYCSQNPSRPMLKALPQSWIGFGAGKSGLYFNWAFRANKKFSVELYIDTGDKAKNKDYFDKIKLSEERIRSALSLETFWERLDEKKASRIALYAKGDINEAMKDNKEKERLINWSIIAMKSFADILKDYIANL